jgi:hypothetical protein
MASRRETPAILDIYVGPNCFGCDTAHTIAKEIQSIQLPGVRIRVIDLGNPANVRPASVFAVPTYLLNGRLLSLGNPEVEWLRDQLTDARTE